MEISKHFVKGEALFLKLCIEEPNTIMKLVQIETQNFIL